jgi:hypothetical protein
MGRPRESTLELEQYKATSKPSLVFHPPEADEKPAPGRKTVNQIPPPFQFKPKV